MVIDIFVLYDISFLNIGSISRGKRSKDKNKIERIDKLRYFGLSDEQIAEVLELPLEIVKKVESDVI
ncbi:hypothetical protein ACOWPH_04655 [Anabaena sp. PCC 7938]|uniref:hypothetical protein n=1 Tax=Anabaena sp. PCC 7938 TaxID=1296340 RepID=UPI0005A92F46|nr:hypothetical protein [Anabaena sp. CCAP 1446/1C]BAY05424.1 hypothetical protein NIES19_46970 [Anabaena cylindrica PCC 7122]